MRICIPVPCFFGKMDFCEAIAKIAQLGFDAAETYNWKSLDLDAVRNACEQSGVELLSMCTTEFNMTNPAKRKDWLNGLKESCAAAKGVGASKLITQVGADTGEERARQHDSIVAALKPVSYTHLRHPQQDLHHRAGGQVCQAARRLPERHGEPVPCGL